MTVPANSITQRSFTKLIAASRFLVASQKLHLFFLEGCLWALWSAQFGAWQRGISCSLLRANHGW
eukprot:8840151-Ditylum_brightwellii.AAC.1